jgi:hypothetical protein
LAAKGAVPTQIKLLPLTPEIMGMLITIPNRIEFIENYSNWNSKKYLSKMLKITNEEF